MPFKPGQREYRSFVDIHADSEPEGSEERSYVVEGYATTFNAPYDFVGDTKEQVLRSALDEADMSDVIFQLNHEGPVLARQRNGSLSISLDDHGMHVTADLGGSQQGRDLYEAISSGLIDRMSWGFTVPDDGWEYDRSTRTSTITRVDKVFDVSAVSRPADEDTEIHARSYLSGVLEAERGESSQRRDMEERRKAAAILELRTLN